MGETTFKCTLLHPNFKSCRHHVWVDIYPFFPFFSSSLLTASYQTARSTTESEGWLEVLWPPFWSNIFRLRMTKEKKERSKGYEERGG
jgi:hypothetical protein